MKLISRIVSAIAFIPILAMIPPILWTLGVVPINEKTALPTVAVTFFLLSYLVAGAAILFPRKWLSWGGIIGSLYLLVLTGKGMIYDPYLADSAIGVYACKTFFFPSSVIIITAVLLRMIERKTNGTANQRLEAQCPVRK